MDRKVLSFGIWVDCSYSHVFAQDAGYLEWLADQGMKLLEVEEWQVMMQIFLKLKPGILKLEIK